MQLMHTLVTGQTALVNSVDSLVVPIYTTLDSPYVSRSSTVNTIAWKPHIKCACEQRATSHAQITACGITQRSQPWITETITCEVKGIYAPVILRLHTVTHRIQGFEMIISCEGIDHRVLVALGARE